MYIRVDRTRMSLPFIQRLSYFTVCIIFRTVSTCDDCSCGRLRHFIAVVQNSSSVHTCRDSAIVERERTNISMIGTGDIFPRLFLLSNTIDPIYSLDLPNPYYITPFAFGVEEDTLKYFSKENTLERVHK